MHSSSTHTCLSNNSDRNSTCVSCSSSVTRLVMRPSTLSIQGHMVSMRWVTRKTFDCEPFTSCHLALIISQSVASLASMIMEISRQIFRARDRDRNMRAVLISPPTGPSAASRCANTLKASYLQSAFTMHRVSKSPAMIPKALVST